MDNIITRFNYGFEYKGIRYGWKNKKLYRLPFSRGGRNYPMKELNVIQIGASLGYRVARDQKSIKQLQMLTKPVDWTEGVLSGIPDCPF